MPHRKIATEDDDDDDDNDNFKYVFIAKLCPPKTHIPIYLYPKNDTNQYPNIFKTWYENDTNQYSYRKVFEYVYIQLYLYKIFYVRFYNTPHPHQK